MRTVFHEDSMGLETEHGSNKSVLPKQPKQKWDEKGGVESLGDRHLGSQGTKELRCYRL